MKFSKGYPKKPGLYKCQADGKDVVLRCSVCELSGRHRWIHLNGSDVLEKEILFGERARLEDI